jgi:hypothetical protein
VRLAALETRWFQQDKEADMSLINDYTYQAMTDARERDLARLVEHDRLVRLALSGRVSWWRKLLARGETRGTPNVQRPAHRTA